MTTEAITVYAMQGHNSSLGEKNSSIITEKATFN